MSRYLFSTGIMKLSGLCACLILSACGGNDFSDLDQFIAKEKAKPKKKIEPLEDIKIVEPFLFELDGSRDPFQPVQKNGEETEIDDDGEGEGKGDQPDFTRRKEELEAYPLDALEMVGTVKKDILWGLVKFEDGIQKVKIGNYMGQNHGQILKVTETEIELEEIVKDKKPKTWFKQKTTLPLKTEE